MKDLLPVAAPGTGSNLFTSASIVDHVMVYKRNLLHLPLSGIINMGYFGILSSLEGLLK